MSILLNKQWRANPNWYDHDNMLDFKTNQITLYGGQTTHLECPMSYYIRVLSSDDPNVIEQGTITFTFHYDVKEQETNNDDPNVKEQDPDVKKTNVHVSYKIYQGDYRWYDRSNDVLEATHQIVFNTSPMPTPTVESLFTILNGQQIYQQTNYYLIK